MTDEGSTVVRSAMATAYDGGVPRELFRIAHPFANHNGGEIAFNPLARPGGPQVGRIVLMHREPRTGRLA